jgi:hypothetical protein
MRSYHSRVSLAASLPSRVQDFKLHGIFVTSLIIILFPFDFVQVQVSNALVVGQYRFSCL